jgi:Ca-activated chloride channel family protein
MPADQDTARRGLSRRGTGQRAARKPLVIGLLAGAVVGAALVGTGFLVVPSLRQPSCSVADDAPLRLVTVPELAPVVSNLLDAETGTRGGTCARPVTVISQSANVTAARLADEQGDRPDVWIPDSSVWTERSTAPGTGVPSDNPSVASSPLVVAVPSRIAAGRGGGGSLRIDQLIPGGSDAANPVPWVLPDPRQSAATVGALLEVKTAVAARPSGAARFGTVIRAADRNPVSLSQEATSGKALPTSEQQLYAYNVAHPRDKLVPAYGASPFRFDYPFVVLTGERSLRDRASQVLDSLQASLGRKLLTAAGFRSIDGAPTPAILEAVGPRAGQVRVSDPADGDAVRAAIGEYRAVTQPSRLLALLDVSGSMSTPVPGAHGATRLDLAVEASVNGLAVYPDDTVVGVWEFTTNLTRTTDYRVIAPLQALGRGPDGITGRQQIAQALAGIHVMHGGTGLNDTILAGIREVRRHWDPNRVNSVVVITDGGNSDRSGISTPALLHTLAAENDPKRPVALFAIAYGPSGDVATLQKIAAVTSGRAYAAPDPRDIGKVLADAIGHRSCAPNC